MVKGATSILLLITLLVSFDASAAMPVFGTTTESKHAREFRPPKGKAIIYIYQLEKDGVDVSPTIWLNNYKIGRLVPGSFTVWKLAPGRLNIRVDGTEPASISMFSKAGKVYLFRLSVTQTNSGPKAQLTGLPESFRADLNSTSLIKNPRTVTSTATRTPARPAKPTTTAKPPSPTKPQESHEIAEQSSHDPVTYLEPGGFGLLLKTGALTLSEDTQTILGVDRSFDDSASGLLTVEGYYQFDSGFTVGGEILNYSAEFTTVGLNDVHDVDVLILLANAKKYYRINSSLQPFIGAGIGYASTDISGPSIGGSTSGLAYQLMAGVEYRSANIGIFGEIKTIGADTESDNNESIDVSGTGFFAGVAFHF